MHSSSILLECSSLKRLLLVKAIVRPAAKYQMRGLRIDLFKQSNFIAETVVEYVEACLDDLS